MKWMFYSVIFFLSLQARAEDGCFLKIKRTGCPGVKDALKPFNNKLETFERFKSGDTSEAACIAEAEKENVIRRKGKVNKKIIQAHFNGKDVGQSFEVTVACK